MYLSYDILFIVLFYLIPQRTWDADKNRINYKLMVGIVSELTGGLTEEIIKNFLFTVVGIKLKKERTESSHPNWTKAAINFVYDPSLRIDIEMIIEQIKKFPTELKDPFKFWAYNMLVSPQSLDKRTILTRLMFEIYNFSSKSKTNVTFSLLLITEIGSQHSDTAFFIINNIRQPFCYEGSVIGESFTEIIEKMEYDIDLCEAFLRKILLPMINRLEVNVIVFSERLYRWCSETVLSLWETKFIQTNLVPSIPLQSQRNERLDYWCVKGSLSNIKILLSQKAEVNGDVPYSPLCLAIINSHLEIVKFLIESKATYEDGYALLTACESNEPEIVSYLMEKQSNLDLLQYNPNASHDIMAVACQHSSIEIIKLLLEAKVSLHAKQHYIRLAEMRQEENEPIVQLLLGHPRKDHGNRVTGQDVQMERTDIF